MIRFTPAIIIGFLLALLTGVGTASAQGSCRSTVDCLADQVCQPGLFGGQCVRLACNFNSDCPAARHLCFFGICQAGCFSLRLPGRGGLHRRDRLAGPVRSAARSRHPPAERTSGRRSRLRPRDLRRRRGQEHRVPRRIALRGRTLPEATTLGEAAMTASQRRLLAIMMLTPVRRMALMARSLPAFAAGVLLLSLLSTTGASAQSCTSNADCGNQALCIWILFQ